jgi:hypothetical protein
MISTADRSAEDFFFPVGLLEVDLTATPLSLFIFSNTVKLIRFFSRFSKRQDQMKEGRNPEWRNIL